MSLLSDSSAPTRSPEIGWTAFPPALREVAIAVRELLADPDKMRLTSAEKTQAYKKAARAVADQFFQALMTIGLEAAVASAPVQQATAALVRATSLRLRNEGLQSVAVRVSRGDQPVRIRVPYYRVKGGRRRRRKGLYPTLVVLGIEDHTTPTLASTVSLAVAMLGPLTEARAHLVQEGTPLDVKTVRTTPLPTAAGPPGAAGDRRRSDRRSAP